MCVSAGAEVARGPESLAGPWRSRLAAARPPGTTAGPDRSPEAAVQPPTEDQVRIDVAHVVVELVGPVQARAGHERG